jgi:hypothetical protein
MGFRVRVFAPDDNESEGAGDDMFLGITCLACGSARLVNPKTGKMAGENGEQGGTAYFLHGARLQSMR